MLKALDASIPASLSVVGLIQRLGDVRTSKVKLHTISFDYNECSTVAKFYCFEEIRSYGKVDRYSQYLASNELWRVLHVNGLLPTSCSGLYMVPRLNTENQSTIKNHL